MAYRVGFYGQQVEGFYGEYSNKKNARKAVVSMAKGNCQKGQSIRWYVDNLDGVTVYSGTVHNK